MSLPPRPSGPGWMQSLLKSYPLCPRLQPSSLRERMEELSRRFSSAVGPDASEAAGADVAPAGAQLAAEPDALGSPFAQPSARPASPPCNDEWPAAPPSPLPVQDAILQQQPLATPSVGAAAAAAAACSSGSQALVGEQGGRQRLDVAERFNSLLSSFHLRLNSLAGIPTEPADKPGAEAAPAAALQEERAEAPAGIHTPQPADHPAGGWLGGPEEQAGGGGTAAVPAAVPGALFAWESSGAGLTTHAAQLWVAAEPVEPAVPGGTSTGGTAMLEKPASLLRPGSAASAAMQTDPAVVPEGVYLRAAPGGGCSGGLLARLVPRVCAGRVPCRHAACCALLRMDPSNALYALVGAVVADVRGTDESQSTLRLARPLLCSRCAWRQPTWPPCSCSPPTACCSTAAPPR